MKSREKTYPQKASDVSVTQKMLYSVRDELKSDIRSLEHNIKSLEHKIDGRFEKVGSELHQMKILMEEQNAKNNVVLDGLTSLFQRQELTNSKVEEIDKALFTLK